uniref:Centriole, cilia and spindle associated protein n=1 Tax=Amphilophus citrinellus TaxID=61819 RepID=A0A3Q0S5M3_AMPCI
MVTKKVRTEYMKKFRDPKWETFSKCYEDSVKYRLTRRVMEHSHKPWFWEGWDSGSDSSGWSTPRLTRNKVAPLSLPLLPISPEVKQRLLELKTSPGQKQSSEDLETEVGEGDAPVVDAAQTTGETTGEKKLSQDDKPAVIRKPPRAKSTPVISTKEKENRRPSSRLDWSERQMEIKRIPNDVSVRLSEDTLSHTSDACVQTRRESDKRISKLDRRRARSADLEKIRRSQLTVVDDRWMTEYMRCFSARLR